MIELSVLSWEKLNLNTLSLNWKSVQTKDENLETVKAKESMTYIVANWKSNKNVDEAGKWMDSFLKKFRPSPNVAVILAPAFLHIDVLSQMINKEKLSSLFLAVQDLSPYPTGAYTGSVAARMVKGLVEYAIVGHSERRKYFHETNQEVANKVSAAVKMEIKPILCVDEPYMRAQVAAVVEEDMSDLIVAYEPVEAIGTGIPKKPEEAEKVVEKISKLAPGRPVLYGGSVNAGSAGNYLKLAKVNGLLVGSACLDPDEFVEICKVAGGV